MVLIESMVSKSIIYLRNGPGIAMLISALPSNTKYYIRSNSLKYLWFGITKTHQNSGFCNN